MMQKLKEVIKNIKKPKPGLAEEAQQKLDSLTKPQGSLGRLEELAKKVVAIKGSINASVEKKVIFTMAGDHGVAKVGISAFPQEVTPQMVYNFLQGGAGINVLAKQVGARVVVVDMGVATHITAESSKVSNFKIKKIGLGTKNMAQGPAMTQDEAMRSIEAGIEVFEEEQAQGIDIVGTGDMGIGNTTASSAIAASFTGKPVEDLTGRGTGINDKAFFNKIAVIKKSLELNKPNPQDAIDVLSKVGGFEIGGIAGVILAAASFCVPVVIDGFISGAAALIAVHLEPKVKDYLISSHCSVEKGHKIILDYMGLRPLLDLDLRLGEGTGSALAMSLIESSIRIMTEMATFKSANVSERND